MGINVSQFHKYNVTDTCAVWNVLSSRVLYSAARSAGCTFCITQFVLYECLYKPRKHSENGSILQKRLEKEQQNREFISYPLTIEDLQDVAILESRQKLSKGELSAMAFAKKTKQAFLTDDQKARKLAKPLLGPLVQTTPHLMGWLFFNQHLGDGDKQGIIEEHKGLGRPLTPYFEEIYYESLRCKLEQRRVVNTN